MSIVILWTDVNMALDGSSDMPTNFCSNRSSLSASSWICGYESEVGTRPREKYDYQWRKDLCIKPLGPNIAAHLSGSRYSGVDVIQVMESVEQNIATCKLRGKNDACHASHLLVLQPVSLVDKKSAANKEVISYRFGDTGGHGAVAFTHLSKP